MLFAGFESSEAPRYFEEGIQLRDKGSLEDAENRFKKALDLEPANTQYHFELANLYAMRYDSLSASQKRERSEHLLGAAARELEQAAMLEPNFIAAHFNLGVIYKRLSRFEEARVSFREILRLDPRHVPSQMQIGSVYEEQGFYDEAEDAYRQAKKMDYRNSDIDLAIEDLKERRETEQRRPLTHGMQSASQLDSWLQQELSKAEQNKE